MKKHLDKIIIVLLMGSIWGAFEVFGVELLKAIQVPHKSPFLFSFALMVMIASKRLNDFPGSAILIAAVALFYKSFSPDFQVCWATQTTAILTAGIVFEVGYRLFRNRIASGMLWRSLAAIVIGYGAYIALLSFDAVVNPEAFAACGGIAGMYGYLSSSGTYATILSVITINLGFYAGEKTKSMLNDQTYAFVPLATKALGLIVISIAWIAQLAY
ncbi:MAG: hypothetical protein GF315_09680 [candidate division Zixibacteria bacterium]|nr:hypothetical protein [candidate division Zixibacteria bacterium]